MFTTCLQQSMAGCKNRLKDACSSQSLKTIHVCLLLREEKLIFKFDSVRDTQFLVSNNFLHAIMN